jgi:hypothetical protein
LIQNETIIPPTLGGSYVYTANTAAAFLRKKAYPYRKAPPPDMVEFKKYELEEARDLDLEEHSRQILTLYDEFVKNRKFDAVIFGAPNGSIVHLALAMGVPYLCSQFRIPILVKSKNENDRDDLTPYAQVVKYIGKRWTTKYDWGTVSCLVDPIHDRMDLGVYAHVREKFTAVPPAFKEFIGRCLKPNGTVIFVNMTYPWISHHIDESAFLQIGGLGEVAPNEYFEGSDRINTFLEAEHTQHRGGWKLTDYEVVQKLESEWSVEPELEKSVQEYCNEQGYSFLPLKQDHPAGFNILTARAMHKKHTADGGSCRGWSINIFWGLCPTLVLRARLLNCWCTFTDRLSLKISEQQLSALLNTFPNVPRRAVLGYYWSYPGAKVLDIVPPSGWLDMLSRHVPKSKILFPGVNDLESTEHDVFEYEDTLYEESKRHAGRESKYNVTVDDLRTMLRSEILHKK